MCKFLKHRYFKTAFKNLKKTHKTHAKHFLKLAGMLSKINSGSQAQRKPREPHETAHLKDGNGRGKSRGRGARE